MNKKTKKRLIFIFLTLIFLLLLRIDYRFNTTVNCCSDEYDYFLHASTIVFDLDFDYSNQKLRDFSYSYKDNKAPIGFVGSGILASPFLFFGNLLTKAKNEAVFETIMNYELLVYSFSSIFYFFLSYLLLYKIMKLMNYNLDKYKLLLYFSATGLPYYSFERFGMTHSYEVFTICLLIYLILNHYQRGKFSNIYAFLVPVVLLISFLTRMSNFFIFLIPAVINRYLFKNDTPLYKNLYFLFSSLLSFVSFLIISNTIYGRVIFNPQIIYGDTRDISASFKNINETFFDMLNSFINTLFTFEFGIFWMNPILFIGLMLTIKNLKHYRKIVNWLTLICFAQCFYLIYLWQTTASSFGFRYLLPLVPLSFFIYFKNNDQNKFIDQYLTYFSVFSFLGIVFFETTILTQLSTTPQVNSFGKYIRYVEPEYVKGIFLSLFNIESYYIIFTTSFLGAIFFKIFFTIFGVESVVNFLYTLGLPVQNKDFQNYIENISLIGIDKFIFSLMFMMSLAFVIVYKIGNENDKNYKSKFN